MITRAIQDAALAYAGAVQAAMRRAQAAYAADERSPAAQRNLRLAAAALVRSDAELAAAYTAHAQRMRYGALDAAECAWARE